MGTKDFFRDIFEYHNDCNQRLMDQLLENENMITERSIPLISHNLNAHQIWNARINDKEIFDAFKNHSLIECKILEQRNFLDSLEILDNYKLDNVINYSNSKGQKFNNSIQEILYHVANHHSHHRGQIISDLREVGIVPITSDYIFFKR